MKKLSLLVLPIIVLLGVLLGLLQFQSCTKDEATPVASFTYSPSKIFVGTTVNFINNSSNAETYKWSFGDGYSSTSTSPSHSYSSPGYKTVTLTATSSSGNKNDVYSQTIYVKESGDAMFWTDYTTNYVITVTLNNINKDITSYYYGIPSSCGADGCATYWDLEPGTYYYYAENYLYWWSGYITVYADECSKMLLYADKANKKTAGNSLSTDKLIPIAEE